LSVDEIFIFLLKWHRPVFKPKKPEVVVWYLFLATTVVLLQLH